MRLVGARKWPTSKNPSAFGFRFTTMEAEELGILMKNYKTHEDQKEIAPNRSGSAPPSIEGSFAAIGNLMVPQKCTLNTSMAFSGSSLEIHEFEEQLRADPAYLEYYCSNVNLNPRLPPPLLSREKRCLARHIGGFGNNSKVTSLDDGINGFMQLSQGSLSPHIEEPEDDRPPCKVPDDRAVSGVVLPEENSGSSAAHQKSSVDLIEGSVEVVVGPSTSDAGVASVSNNGLPGITFSNLSHTDGIISSLPPEKHKTDAGLETKSIISTVGSGISGLEPKTMSFGSSTLPLGEYVTKRQEPHQDYGRNRPQWPSTQQDTLHHVQGNQPQVISQGSNSKNGPDKALHLQPKFSPIEVRQVLPSPGLTPPLYATAAAYMTPGNPFYPNLQQPGLYASQYNMGGYALGSAVHPPFMAGYPSQSAIPMHFDGISALDYNGRTGGVSIGETFPYVGDYRHVNKIHGQQGLMLQPSFVDPLQLQYFQHPFEVAYSGAPGQYDHFRSRGDIGGQKDSFVLQESAYRHDIKLLPPSIGSLGSSSTSKGGATGSSYYGRSTNMGAVTQFSASPLAGPVLPGSSTSGTNLHVRRNEMRLPQSSIRNTGVYSGWQGQRRGDGFDDDPKKHSFLEELKANNSRKFELSDIAGRIVEFSVDQHGSRFIQQKLEYCAAEDKASVFKEVLSHASKLMTDVFGNYVIQKFFEYGSIQQRRELANQLSGQMLNLSLQMYGCRVIQKALEWIELDQKTQLVYELDGHVMRCVRDQNGNHVIQKCIECVPTEKIGFLISSFQGQVAALSTHPYGCRVIQRLLEHCSEELQSQCIVDEILESACVLAQDQYGNYVTQHVLDKGKPHERSKIINKLSGKIVEMSQHKYASNVIEKCLEHGDAYERDLVIREIMGQSQETDNLLTMMKDQFANYVVQKILDISSVEQKELLLNRIRGHLHALKKYTYGKHIVARFEQLYGEGSQASDS